MQKRCSNCKIIKDTTFFSKRKKSKDGYNGRCKMCIYEYMKKYRQNYTNKQKKQYKIKAKQYNITNKEKLSKHQEEYRSKNVEAIKNYQKNWYIKNKKRIQKYISNNRKKINKYYRNYVPSINAKIAKSLHTNILATVKRAKVKKTNSSIKLLGCSIDFFKQYIESKFTQGMTWDNYGKNGWHFDHIKPCSSFNLSNSDEQKLCFHYTNYQPLWATREIAIKYGENSEYIGNLEKGYKYENFSC